ncbi:MAG: hypothetical protein AB2805_05090 [Candidatus Thiodiazotropha sp.]
MTGPNTIQAASEHQLPHDFANGMTIHMPNKQTVREPATGLNNLCRESEDIGFELHDFEQLLFLWCSLRVFAVIGVHLRLVFYKYITRLGLCGVLESSAPFIFEPIR